MAQQRFSKDERIKKRADFLKVYKEGTQTDTGHFKIAVLPNSLNTRRLGITVSKKTGNAVRRNRIKRCLREYFRQNKELFPPSSDIVITARTGAGSLKFAQIAAELEKADWEK